MLHDFARMLLLEVGGSTLFEHHLVVHTLEVGQMLIVLLLMLAPYCLVHHLTLTTCTLGYHLLVLVVDVILCLCSLLLPVRPRISQIMLTSLALILLDHAVRLLFLP